MKKIVPISIFIFAFVYQFLFGNRYINLINEGYIYYGAAKILEGSMIYRDYFTPYTPGLFYLTAFFFKLFGLSIAVGRSLTIFASALTAVVVFYLARRILSVPFAISASVLYVVWAAFSIPFLGVTVMDLLKTPIVYKHMSVTYFSTSFALVGLLFMFKYLERKTVRWLCLSGVFIGVALLFKQNTGIFALGAFSLFFLAEIKDRGTLKNCIKRISILAASMMAVTLPIITYFYFAAFPYFKGDLFDYIVKYPSFGIIPPPALFPLITLLTAQFPTRVFFYASIFLFLGFFIYSFISLRKGADSRHSDMPYLLLISMFGGFMIFHVYPTFNYVRFSPALVPFFILLCYFTERTVMKLRSIGNIGSHGSSSKIVIAVKAGGILLATAPIFLLMGNAVPITIENYQKMAGQNSMDYLSMEENAVPDILAYLAENTSSDEKILALPADTLIYFLADRNGPSRVPQVVARVDTLEHQEAVITDIKRDQIRVIVYSYHKVLGYNILERFPEYASVLYNYIIDNYRIEKQISKDTVIFVRDDSGRKDVLWKEIRGGSGTAAYGAKYNVSHGRAMITTGLLEDGSVRTYLLIQPNRSGKSRWNFSLFVPDEDGITLRLAYGFHSCNRDINGTVFSAFTGDKEVLAINKTYIGELGEIDYSLGNYRGRIVNISLLTDSRNESTCTGIAWIPSLIYK